MLTRIGNSIPAVMVKQTGDGYQVIIIENWQERPAPNLPLYPSYQAATLAAAVYREAIK